MTPWLEDVWKTVKLQDYIIRETEKIDLVTGPVVDNVVFSLAAFWMGLSASWYKCHTGWGPQHFQLLHSFLDNAPQTFYIPWKLKDGCCCHGFILKNELFFRSSNIFGFWSSIFNMVSFKILVPFQQSNISKFIFFSLLDSFSVDIVLWP